MYHLEALLFIIRNCYVGHFMLRCITRIVLVWFSQYLYCALKVFFVYLQFDVLI